MERASTKPATGHRPADATIGAVVTKAISAAVVTRGEDGDEATYSMFDAHDVTAEGAFLVGALFMEQGEEFTLELTFDPETRIRTQARVTAVHRGGHSDSPGMKVAFPALGDTDRAVLEAQSPSQPTDDPEPETD